MVVAPFLKISSLLLQPRRAPRCPVATLGTTASSFHSHCNYINSTQNPQMKRRNLNLKISVVESTVVPQGPEKRIKLLDTVLLRIAPRTTPPDVAPGSPCALRKLKMSWPCHLILRPLLAAVTSHGSDK